MSSFEAIHGIIEILNLEEIEKNHYRATSPSEGWQRVYGGQVISQALMAAAHTVPEDRIAHSLHGYFLRAGDTEIPILYKVERTRDGHSFTTRQVTAIQRGRPIFALIASFQVDEAGAEHQFDAPQVDSPASYADDEDIRAEHAKNLPDEIRESFLTTPPVHIRPIDPVNMLDPTATEPRQRCWMKSRESLPDDLRLHQCVLAYLSDWSLLDTAARPHALSYLQDNLQMASLDHAMWFHRPFRADEWLLYDQDSPSASNSRGFNRGLIYDQAGQLVASTTQEGLMRVHPESSS